MTTQPRYGDRRKPQLEARPDVTAQQIREALQRVSRERCEIIDAWLAVAMERSGITDPLAYELVERHGIDIEGRHTTAYYLQLREA